MHIVGVINFLTDSSSGLHSTVGGDLVMLNQHCESFCISPAQNESGALICYSFRRFDDIFSNGSCCGLAVICQSHFCIYPIPMDTSSFRICFEYIKLNFFSSFNHTFNLLENTLSKFISTLMILHKAHRSWSHGWMQPNPISSAV